MQKSKPSISLNKLGEYLNATPQRRRRIVSDAKDPEKFIVTRYADAKEAIKGYFISAYDSEVIEESMKSHREKDCAPGFQTNDRTTSIEALESILETDLPDLSDYAISLYNGGNQKIDISGVSISVSPDLIVRGSYKNMDVFGLVKIHVSKGHRLGKEGLQYVATVLRLFAETYIASDTEKVKPNLCISIDTFGQVYEVAPTAFAKRMSDIKIACEEIALWWDKV